MFFTKLSEVQYDRLFPTDVFPVLVVFLFEFCYFMLYLDIEVILDFMKNPDWEKKKDFVGVF